MTWTKKDEENIRKLRSAQGKRDRAGMRVKAARAQVSELDKEVKQLRKDPWNAYRPATGRGDITILAAQERELKRARKDLTDKKRILAKRQREMEQVYRKIK